MSKNKKRKKLGEAFPLIKNPIILTVAITLIAVILFGSVTGIIIAVRNHRAIITVGGVRIEKSTAAYLATSYKTTFMQKYKANDTQTFWDSEYKDGKTYGQLLFEETEAYIREVAVGDNVTYTTDLLVYINGEYFGKVDFATCDKANHFFETAQKFDENGIPTFLLDKNCTITGEVGFGSLYATSKDISLDNMIFYDLVD